MAPKRESGETNRAPTQEEIKAAVLRSGYPFEIRLAKKFEEYGMNPSFGVRRRVGKRDGETHHTHEIDLTVQITEVLEGARITIGALIEAKSLEKSARFIGFPWAPPPTFQQRANRLCVGGQPALLQGVWPPNALEDHGLGAALDPLNEPIVCEQWALLRRGGNDHQGDYFAGHDSAFHKGIDGVFRATVVASEEHSNPPVWPAEAVVLLFEYPTLVVATPEIVLFDAEKGEVTGTTDSIVLMQQVELADGRVATRPVDVVTEPGIEAFVARRRRAMAALAERMTPEFVVRLRAIAKVQRQERYPQVIFPNRRR